MIVYLCPVRKNVYNIFPRWTLQNTLFIFIAVVMVLLKWECNPEDVKATIAAFLCLQPLSLL